MDRHRQITARGGSCAESLVSMMIAVLLRVGVDQSAVAFVANSIITERPMPANSDMRKYAEEQAQIFIERERLSDRLVKEEEMLAERIAKYKRAFGTEPYLGLPIGEMSLPDQIKEIQRQIQVLNYALSSRCAIPDEPMQEMGAGLPPPIFYTGTNHCAIASMLSLISILCMLLGYTGNAPKRSLSITLGDAFKRTLGISQDRCIVIEDIFKYLQIFLDILREEFPPYAPFLRRIFTLFSSKTFSRNIDGSCSLHSGSKEVSSFMNHLDESNESLENRLQQALLTCGSEPVHPHLQMDPGAISAFFLPCAIPDNCGGLVTQTPFTAESLRVFQLFGTNCSNRQFGVTTNLFAAICDTQGRNSAFAAEQVAQAGTSHYYLVISYDGKFFLVDSSRTHVQQISQDVFLDNVNVNGIVIFMRNQNTELVSSSSSQKSSARGSAAAQRSAQPCRSFSADGGEAAVQHQPPCSYGYSQHVSSKKESHHCRHVARYDGTKMPDLKTKNAFYYAVTNLISQSTPYPLRFEVTDLSLVRNDLDVVCEEGVHILGSFGFFDGTQTYFFRAIGVQFENGYCVNHEGPAASLNGNSVEKQQFVDCVNNEWQSFMIIAITFARCN